MLVLGIDTAGKTGSVAIYSKKTGLVAEINLHVKLNHSDTLMMAVDDLFKYSSYTIDDIALIATTIGPGSFTGIRVGVATAKGLAIAANKKIVGVNALDVLAATVGITELDLVTMLDARKERVYYAKYRYNTNKLERVSEYKADELNNILLGCRGEKLLFTGDGAYNYKKLIEEKLGNNALFGKQSNIYSRACVLAELALNVEETNVHLLEPFYLSKSQAERMKILK